MTTITAGPAGLDMSSSSAFLTVLKQTITPTSLTLTLSDNQTQVLTGVFSVDAKGSLIGGAITGEQYYDGQVGPQNVTYTISDMNLPVTTYVSYVQANNISGLYHLIFAGGDKYVGSTGTDVLVGLGGGDTFIGGTGTETFEPSSGNNTVTGGSGLDVVVFGGPRSAYTITGDGAGNIVVTDSDLTRNGVTHASSVTALKFSDQEIFVATPDQAAIARLYSAAFDRAPDAAGLQGWEAIYTNDIPASAKGADWFTPLAMTNATGIGFSIAYGFTNSTEFQTKYGALNNTQFVTQLYENVLHRAPDQTGLDGWLNFMSQGDGHYGPYTREMVLVGFAESTENISKVAAAGWILS